VLVRRALAATAVAVAAVGVLVTSTATAAGGKCVALVVDSTHIGGPVSNACVTVATGATGSDVLAAAHHKLTYRADGLICAIDGRPAGGCSTVDGTHYWAYYHRPPGSSSWQYSQEGSGSYVPPNASTEGWVYDDGESPAPQPSNVAYKRLCPAASPSPTPTRTTSHPATTATATATTTTRRASGSVTTSTSPSPQPHHASSPLDGRAASTVTTLSATAPDSTPSATPLRTPPPSAHSSAAHGTSLPVAPIGGGLAAAALGAAAVIRLRRSRG
jgi:hypothetical protein